MEVVTMKNTVEWVVLGLLLTVIFILGSSEFSG
jgi:hypothetical protein